MPVNAFQRNRVLQIGRACGQIDGFDGGRASQHFYFDYAYNAIRMLTAARYLHIHPLDFLYVQGFYDFGGLAKLSRALIDQRITHYFFCALCRGKRFCQFLRVTSTAITPTLTLSQSNHGMNCRHSSSMWRW